jgi:hypothetical protein
MTPTERFGELARGTVYSIAAGSAASAIGSGRVMARQVAVDAFGNALGYALANSSSYRGELLAKEVTASTASRPVQLAAGPTVDVSGYAWTPAFQLPDGSVVARATDTDDLRLRVLDQPLQGTVPVIPSYRFDASIDYPRLGVRDLMYVPAPEVPNVSQESDTLPAVAVVDGFAMGTPTGSALTEIGDAANSWLNRNRAEYNQHYESALRNASSPFSAAVARTGRALSNVPFDLGAGAVGLYTLATDRSVQARTLSSIGDAVMNPVSTASGALGAARSYLASTSLPQMAEDVTRVAVGAALTGGLGRLTQVTSRAAVGNSEVLLQTGGRQVLNPSRIEGWDAAERAYGSIRADRTDIAAIAQNTGIPEATIKRIKGHVFENVHLLDSGLRRFDADPNIVNSWSRLQQGDFSQSDLGFLAHERFEAKFEALFRANYRTAHEAAERSGRVWKPE